ncbi:MAG TPA: CRISPR-associated endonuclease Cas2 [Thermoplasmatales archaeon]|nr:CRISPR-associated endonuclease Cas2 [Thermoplasmatales archaeon]
MYVVVVYDVGVDRVSKVCHFLRRYLNWIQNSVFEGELTESQLMEVKAGLKQLIDKKEDSVRIYRFRCRDAVKVDVVGIEKVDTGNII